MGDVLRQLLYPLVLPAIVACVWVHAWAVKQEPGYRPAHSGPGHVADLGAAPASVPPPQASGYGFASVEPAAIED